MGMDRWVINGVILIFCCRLVLQTISVRMEKALQLSIQQATQHLHQHGYAIIKNFISPQLCQRAISQIDSLIDGFQPNEQNMTVFGSTNGKSTHRFSKYFLQSSDKVRFFFQPKALEEGKLTVPKKQAINKIGHALHEHNKIFGDITYSPVTWQICKLTGRLNPQVVQSMAILKPPKIGNRVKIHQDSTHLYSQPDTLLGFWMPLQDATKKNGCLWGLPGSHTGKLYHRSKIIDKNPIDDIYHEVDYNEADFVPMQMQRGSLAIFTGKFLHRSLNNESQVSRYAYSWHLMDGSSQWCRHNWLQRDSFSSFIKRELV